MRNKVSALLLVLALLVVGFGSLVHAQSTPYATGGDVDRQGNQSWTQYSANTGATSALVITSTTGAVTKVLAFHLASADACIVVFQSAANGTTIAQFYVAANTALNLDERHLGDCFKSTSGGGIYVYKSTGTGNLTFSARVKTQ